MKITFYTVDEFMEELIEPENFWARIKILDFMPTVIATWSNNEKEQKEFDEWWKDFEDMEDEEFYLPGRKPYLRLIVDSIHVFYIKSVRYESNSRSVSRYNMTKNEPTDF